MNKLFTILIFVLIVLFAEGNAQLSNYSFTCSRNNPYVPISGSPGPTGDDQVMTVTMPFSFNFLGVNYTYASICTNGWVALGITTYLNFFGGVCTLTGGYSVPLLCPFWYDLYPPGGGNIQYGTIGTIPNRKFIVQYTNVAFFSGTGNVTVQLILNETSNVIQFLYGPVIAGGNVTPSVGIRGSGGGNGSYISVKPAPICDSTLHSSYVCYDGVPLIQGSLTTGVLYTFGPLVGIHEITGELPKQFKLYQNYPNPFNPVTKITFDIPGHFEQRTSNVELIIYDILGREVATLVNEELKPGKYEVEWNAVNYPSGIYYYQLTPGNFTQTRKMILLK
jgi:type IX secretion system substrate protein